MSELKTGQYCEWEWNETRKCWEALIPLRIYPSENGRYLVSTNEMWLGGEFRSFDEAEKRAMRVAAPFAEIMSEPDEQI